MITTGRAPGLFGVIAPVLTPFRVDLSVDYRAWERLIGWLLEHDVDGLFIAGGSGEGRHLSAQERVELARRAVRIAAGCAPVIAGSLGRDLAETLAISHALVDAGVDFLGIMVPRFVAADEPSVCGFFETLLERLPYPTMLYDPPDSGEHALRPGWLRRLSRIESVVALKKTTRDLRLFSQLAEAAGPGFAMICGDETVMLPCLSVGAVGCIGGGANIFPELMRAVFKAFHSGDLAAARAAHFRLEQANRLIESGDWPLVGKVALAARGLPVQPVTRKKSRPLEPECRRAIEKFFKQKQYAI